MTVSSAAAPAMVQPGRTTGGRLPEPGAVPARAGDERQSNAK